MYGMIHEKCLNAKRARIFFIFYYYYYLSIYCLSHQRASAAAQRARDPRLQRVVVSGAGCRHRAWRCTLISVDSPNDAKPRADAAPVHPQYTQATRF